jgi:hypothetical protein
MRLARLTAHVLPLCIALSSAAPARAQEPVREYTPAARYSTFQLGAQVTGRNDRGRDVLFSWGRMRTMGEGGAWMPWLGLTAGFTSGRDFIGGLVAGPTVGFGYAIPGQHMSFGRATRAEPYVLAQASAYGIGRFRGELEAAEAGQDDGWGVAPALAAGIGFRLFADEWDVDLSTLELVVEKRLGFGEDAAQLYVRFGRAVAPRERRDRGADPGIASATALPPPPEAQR